MIEKDTDAMHALDARLAKMLGGLDTSPGFEDRLRARIAASAAERHAPPAETLARLEREHARARAAARHAAQIDIAAIAVAGLGGLAASWRLSTELVSLYVAAEQAAGPTGLGFATLALAGVALWAALRWFNVPPKALLGA